MSIQQAIFDATASIQSTTPRLDAELLLAKVLGKSRSYCFSHAEQALTAEQQRQYGALIDRRKAGEPIAYIIGKKGFWNLTLMVTKDTLIPRPETELLIEIVLDRLDHFEEYKIADLGTGSGAIALALGKASPNWQIFAVDRSPNALEVAAGNAEKKHIDNVMFFAGSWFEPLPSGKLNAIVANPPYIAAGNSHLQIGDVRFEPETALVSGIDGLDDIRRIVKAAPEHLLPGGFLLLEHGFDQGGQVRELMRDAGFSDVETHLDLAGHERATIGVLKGD